MQVRNEVRTLFNMENLKMENLKKEFNMNSNDENKKKRETSTIGYSLFKNAIQKISDITNEPISKCCTLFGYSRNAQFEWSKNERAPMVAYWAAVGYLSFLKEREKEREKEKENFSNEELQRIVEILLTHNEDLDLAIKAVQIIQEKG